MKTNQRCHSEATSRGTRFFLFTYLSAFFNPTSSEEIKRTISKSQQTNIDAQKIIEESQNLSMQVDETLSAALNPNFGINQPRG